MKRFLLFVVAIAILGVAGSACLLILTVRDTAAALPGIVDRRLESVQTAAIAEIRRQASPLVPLLDRQLSGARQDLRDSVFLAVSPIQGLREDLRPTLANLQSISGHLNDSVALGPELARNALGAVAAFKITSGELTKTAIDFRRATPGILETLQKVGANSDAATVEAIGTAQESRRLVHNLAVNTTPLPKWVRYPAQVIGLVGSAAVPVVTLQRLSKVP